MIVMLVVIILANVAAGGYYVVRAARLRDQNEAFAQELRRVSLDNKRLTSENRELRTLRGREN